MNFSLLVLLFIFLIAALFMSACFFILFPLYRKAYREAYKRTEGNRFLSRSNYPLILLGCFLPLGALILYASIGSPLSYIDYQRTRAAIKEEGAVAVLEQNLAGLEERLVQEPHNDQLRMDIARGYFALGQADKALRLASYPLMRKTESSLALLLQLHYHKSGWDEQAEDLARQLDLMNDEHPTLLSLRALEAAAKEDYETAISLWRRLLALDLSTQEEGRILELIKEAQQALTL